MQEVLFSKQTLRGSRFQLSQVNCTVLEDGCNHFASDSICRFVDSSVNS